MLSASRFLKDAVQPTNFLRWNLGQIELGRYYERLVCSNGQTEAVHQVESKMLSLDERSIKNMLALPGDESALNNSFFAALCSSDGHRPYAIIVVHIL